VLTKIHMFVLHALELKRDKQYQQEEQNVV